ncbi:UTP--glucose-1-phosphate uridylyltransferase [Linum grandiflorum]
MTIHSVIIQKLLSTNAHLGKRAAAHHFKIFTSGVRDGVSIIDSDKTLICLRNATNFIGQLAREKNARFLFVNTNPLFDEIVEQMTKKIGLYSPRDKIIWKMGGFLTNSFSPKKFRSRNKKVCFAPVQPPDCVVVLDTDRKSSVILEAARLQVPIVALVDSNLPRDYYEKIAYPIPANDSMEFVYLFCNIITKTFLLERKKMREANGDTVEDEPSISSKELGKEFQRSEQSKSITRTSSATDEVLVVPYESLVPILEDSEETKQILDKLVVVKLNSTLGTAVGFNGPKSMIDVRDGVTSLDLLVNQIQNLNQKYGSDIPLVLINSARTHDDTSKVLEQYSTSNIDILPVQQGQQLGESPDVLENENKLYASDQAAALRSLIDSGALDVLLAKGKEYVLVVSPDNSAVAVDAKILNHLITNKIVLCMEVMPTPGYYSTNPMVNDSEGNFQLGEIAEDPSAHSMEKFKFISTKTLWLSLNAIKRLADTNSLKVDNVSTSEEVEDNQLPSQDFLPLSVTQLFDKAVGINVPQSRFLQLNTTSDLLLVKSDLYAVIDGSLARNPFRSSPLDPSIQLGPEFEKIDHFESRFQSIPSIVELDALKVTGDVWFGAGVTLKGNVSINAKPGTTLEIPNDSVIDNKDINDVADI